MPEIWFIGGSVCVLLQSIHHRKVRGSRLRSAVKAGEEMLQAILSSKAGRIGLEDESQRW